MFLFILSVFCVSAVYSQSLGLTEGSSCTWNGVTGRCVSIYKCMTAYVDIKNKEYPPTCSFDGETPIICCTDCDLVDDTRLYLFNSVLGVLKKTGTSRAKDKCLEYIDSLEFPCKRFKLNITFSKDLDPIKNCSIFDQRKPTRPPGASGGFDALRGQFPHMALLGYGDSMETAEWLCGGSVISERFILTAGHCLSSPSAGPVRYIALGILKRTDSPELWQRYNVSRVIRHPEYKPPSKYHDIALLETDREISFSSQVLPACLHTDDKVDETAIATGWGALGHRQALADVLQAVRLHRFSDEECSEFYAPHRLLKNGYNHSTQMCYGDRKDTAIPTDTCQGDSGGPLQSFNHEQCVFTILGVTSFGAACGFSGGSGMYTRVKYYVPWIEDIVWT